MSDAFTLKKLRALCLDIHEEQSAILLRSCLAEFPIPVINEFFTGPKLNKPSNGEEREWTDIVRLTLIALAPVGSEPAKLRGTPFGRYVNSYPYEPNRNDADAVGLLTLRRTSHTSPLLKDIVTGLGIQTLRIESEKWLECYLANPFPIKSLEVYIDSWEHSLPCLREDLSLALDLLPDSLEQLSLRFPHARKLPKLNGYSISRFSALTKLSLEIDSLPEGIDFSKNSQLESITLELKKSDHWLPASSAAAPKPIVGIGQLKKLKSLIIYSDESIPLESIAPHFKNRINSIGIFGIDYLEAEICGESPESLELGRISGLRKITLHTSTKESSKVKIGAHAVESLKISGGFSSVEVRHCPQLLNLQADIQSSCDTFKIGDCNSIGKIEAVFRANIKHLELENLPTLSEASFEAPTGCDVIETYDQRHCACKFLNIGAKQLPEFKGAWREFSRIEISSCPNLENLSGLHVLPDLRLIKLENLRAMHNLFPPSAPALPTLSHLHAENVRVLAPAGFESMPSLSKLEWIGCSLDSMTGVESLQVLEGVDLTGSDLRSIAPFASLPILQSIRVSKCDSIKPKPARVLLEGDELARELSRATGGKVTAGARGDFFKVVELLSSGNVDDINQAVHFISVLTDDERGRLLSGAGINPETGWIRLPFLTKLKDKESQGLPQFRIIYALRNVDLAAARILESVDTIVLNPRGQQTKSALCFGLRDSAAQGDLVLEEFPSLEALPSLKNIKKIVVNTVSRFSLRGVTNFPALESLTVLGVNAIEHIESLGGHANLKNLELSRSKITGLPAGEVMTSLHEIGRLPALETLFCDQNFETLDGINNFPELKRMRTRSIDDLSELFEISKKRKKKIAFKESFGWGEGVGRGEGFELV